MTFSPWQPSHLTCRAILHLTFCYSAVLFTFSHLEFHCSFWCCWIWMENSWIHKIPIYLLCHEIGNFHFEFNFSIRVSLF